MSFSDLLKADHLEAPKNVPAGHWKVEVQGLKLKDPADPDDANYKKRALITGKPIEPGDDVDVSEAEEFMNSDDFEDARLFYSAFMRGKRDAWKLKTLLEKMGYEGSIEDAQESGTLEGYTATMYVEHEFDDDGDVVVRVNEIFVD